MRPLRAGTLYFAAIFALGFLLGTLRTLFIAPAIGETGAVIAELPMILGASWFAAKRITRRCRIFDPAGALTMGAIAFVLLMAAELALAVALGRTVSAWLADLVHVPGVIGLAGQIAFGLIPLFARRPR